MNKEEIREHFDFKEEPTIRNRIRFILQNPRYSQIDKVEYFAYLFFGLGAIIITLLLLVLYLLPNVGIELGLELSLILILGFFVLIAAWRKSRKIEERFVYPYRVWVGGEEYAQKAPVLSNQMMNESMMRGQEKGIFAFIWTSRLLFGFYIIFYIAGILFTIVYPLPTGLSSFVIIGGGAILLVGLIILRKDIHGYFQAVRQDPKLLIPFSLLVVFIGAILGLLWLYLIGVIQISIPLER